MSDRFDKEVRFDKYCKTCENKKLKETEKPCVDCLAENIRYASERPVNYKERKNNE